MAEDETPKQPYLPFSREQNPAPVPLQGQQATDSLREITNLILETFERVLPSNYISQVPGPYYNLQFQSFAEELSKIQLTLQDTGLDSDVDFTRPEYLWQTIGTLVFPDVSQDGLPIIPGDLSYRTFLKRMILLLLQGATLETQKQGIELLTDALVQVLAKVDYSNESWSAWGFPEQHEFEINLLDKTTWTDPDTGELIEGDFGTGFPELPFRLLRNARIVLRALKPAKALYEYRHLFLDTFGELFQAQPFFDLCPWYYEDFRKFCCGYKWITGTGGITLTNRFLFSDPTRNFRLVCPGSVLTILTGPNTKPTSGGKDSSTLGAYVINQVLYVPFGTDETPRAYTTSPTGLSGTVTVNVNGELEDLNQDFSLAEEGEILTISEGPNSGSFRLQTLLGESGGPVGFVTPGSNITGVRVAPGILELQSRMPEVATEQQYTIGLERLGVKIPVFVFGEDVSAQFYL